MPVACSQISPAWAQVRLGQSALTIGEAGCLLCSMASLLTDLGRTTDPLELNRWLRDHHGFAAGVCLDLRAVEPLGVRLRCCVDYYASPANLERIGAGLARGWGALALVDCAPGTACRDHWVRVLAVDRHDCTVMDPWQQPGCEIVSLRDTYGGPGWNAARSIFVYVAYSREGAAPRRRRRTCRACVQDQVSLR